MARRTEEEEGRVPWKLADHPQLGKGKVVGVVVLDGWAEAPPDPFNCIHVTDTPTLDALEKIILDAIEHVAGIFVVTADHGNAEDMVKREKSGKPLGDKDGNVQPLTSHTLNPVPIAIGGPGLASGARFRKDLPDAGPCVRNSK